MHSVRLERFMPYIPEVHLQLTTGEVVANFNMSADQERGSPTARVDANGGRSLARACAPAGNVEGDNFVLPLRLACGQAVKTEHLKNTKAECCYIPVAPANSFLGLHRGLNEVSDLG